MAAKNRSLLLNIRVTIEEKAGFDLASEIAGLSLSSWVRERLRSKAIRELKDAGHKVPFIPEIPIPNAAEDNDVPVGTDGAARL